MGIDLLKRATAAINNWKTLTLTCAHCGKVEQFRAADRKLATDKAVKAGWHSREFKELCKKCF